MSLVPYKPVVLPPDVEEVLQGAVTEGATLIGLRHNGVWQVDEAKVRELARYVLMCGPPNDIL